MRCSRPVKLPELARFIPGFPDPYREEDARSFVAAAQQRWRDELVSRWAIDDLRVERLALTAAPDNAASQRVAEKAGFRREGLLRSHLPFRDGRRDSVLFSLLPSDLV